MIFGLRCLLILSIGIFPLRAQFLPVPERITAKQGLPQAFVPAILQDKQGFIWMATRDGLARYDGTRFKVFQPDPDGRPSLTSADVAQLRLDHHGNLWIANERGDLDVFDPTMEQFTNLSKQSIFKQLRLNTSQLNRYCIDRQDRLWITSTGDGLVCLDRRTNRIRHYRYGPDPSQSLSHNDVAGVLEGPGGMIWAVTSSGLDAIDANAGTIRHYLGQQGADAKLRGLWVRPSGDVLVMTNQRLYVLEPASGRMQTYPLPAASSQPAGYAQFAEDQHGTLYIAWGTALFSFARQQGVQLLDAGNAQPQQVYHTAFVDRSDVLWLGTAGAGVCKYDLRAQPFQTARYRRGFVADLLTQGWLNGTRQPWPSALTGLTDYNFRYAFDGRGRLWFNMGSSDLYRLDLQTRQTERVPFPVSFRSPFIGITPCPMATDPTGRVWAAYDSAAYWYDEQRAQWQAFAHRIPRQPDNALQMLVVDGQALWLATSTGGLLRIDRVSGRVRTYLPVRGQTTSLSSNALLCMATDPDDPNILWIGTFGSGLCRFDKRSGRANRLTQAEGLPNNVIYSILPDRHGNLWVGTNRGIGRINRQTLRVQTYTIEDGILADEFNRFHFLYLPSTANDGIILGGLEGITAFYPHQIQADTFRPRVELTALYVNNQPVFPEPNSVLGEQPIQAASALTLPYDQNFLTIEFAALQFNRPHKNRYRYQLLGLNPTWVESHRPEAIFTGLQPGAYTLRLNATNVSGSWSPHVRTLSIVVHPPWWATGWAYALYALVVVGIGYGLFRNYVKRLRLQQSVALRQQEAEQLRDTNAMKTRFFTNITHEFRTPLTLILAPVEQMASEHLEPRNRRRLVTIEQNAHQLLRLINQLLDLSKLEASVMPIRESRGDLTECIRHWLQPLGEQARSQGLTLTFTSDVTGTHQFDTEKLERIVYNLTANALKFTQTGVISVSLTASPEGIVLTVTDTGNGIAPQELPHIFDRFYQAGPVQDGTIQSGPELAGLKRDRLRRSAEVDTEFNPSERPPYPGTGIGLALVKELVQLQQGRIAVESVLNQGTTFRIELPYRQLTLTEDALDLTFPSGIDDNAWTSPDELEEPRLLIVEDNDELAHFIAESLPQHYRIRRVTNGHDGLALALEQTPDLIISDVMMPGMDGFTLCGKLKTDVRTSHIPVILLTARVSVEDRLEGLTQGADDYLTKPFQIAELQLRVRNQLLGKRRQRDWVRASLLNPDEAQPASQPTDPFLTQLYELMEVHLDETNFGLEQMMMELGLSRSNLFRKVKALTGLSATDLLRQYRIKRGAQLLLAGHSVSDTAYRVGFESPPYFAKCFREVYQLTPSQFAAQFPLTS